MTSAFSDQYPQWAVASVSTGNPDQGHWPELSCSPTTSCTRQRSLLPQLQVVAPAPVTILSWPVSGVCLRPVYDLRCPQVGVWEEVDSQDTDIKSILTQQTWQRATLAPATMMLATMRHTMTSTQHKNHILIQESLDTDAFYWRELLLRSYRKSIEFINGCFFEVEIHFWFLMLGVTDGGSNSKWVDICQMRNTIFDFWSLSCYWWGHFHHMEYQNKE